ncbi:low-density lipoprotein receptor-related protein 12-like [Stegodyphus dumicola]|uniref:low-density lipoprotein receptor-related protein 12-like n=1 Tax=Stegodyphus dumicola TaxID=202533 RepID=UPI0015AA4A43|nr:low-density lipoprotein receptor-related protein 12-like [Stegodyphus dumicola]
MRAARYCYIIFAFCLILKECSADSSEEEPFQCHELYIYNVTQNGVVDVYSPFYKEGGYTNDLWCEYEIRAPPGNQLKIIFKELDIDPSDFCGQDSLVIYSGAKEHVIATVCGTNKPEPIITDPGVNIVHLLFRSDHMSVARGVHLQFQAGPHFEYCPPGKKVCSNRKCYDETSQKCNGVDDCGDGTDEEGCSKSKK